MKTLRDGAVLLVLLMLLVSVRVTPPEETKGGIIPEARAAAEPAVEVAEPPTAAAVAPTGLLGAVGIGSLQTDGDCALRMKTLRTEQGGTRMIVIEIDQVETTESPSPAVPTPPVPRTTC